MYKLWRILCFAHKQAWPFDIVHVVYQSVATKDILKYYDTKPRGLELHVYPFGHIQQVVAKNTNMNAVCENTSHFRLKEITTLKAKIRYTKRE